MSITSPLLAKAIDNVNDIYFPVLATPKVDGIRALRINDKLVSRTFTLIRNQKMQELLTTLLPTGSDGEIILAGTFQDTDSAVMRGKKSADFKQQFSYYWFDYVKDDPNKSYVDRLQDMKTYLSKHPEILQHPQAKIIPLFPTEIKNKKELDAYEEKVLSENFEGVMLRSGKGKYKMGRSTVKEGILMKMKRFCDEEAIIISCIEQMTNGNEIQETKTGGKKRGSGKDGLTPADKLGSLIVKDMKTNVEFCVGSGFTESQRCKLWEDKDSLTGKIITYRYFPIGVKKAPRFPTFQSFRSLEDMDVNVEI